MRSPELADYNPSARRQEGVKLKRFHFFPVIIEPGWKVRKEKVKTFRFDPF